MQISYKQSNHVILAQTAGRRNLINIYNNLGYGKYRPKTYSALTQKFANPKSTVILFSTGNITSMGSSTYYGALLVLLKVKNQLNIDFLHVKLSNIVINFSVNQLGKLDLDKFFERNSEHSTYDLEVFPCLTYNIENTKIKANIFATGNVVLAGCYDHIKIKESIEFLLIKISNCINAQ